MDTALKTELPSGFDLSSAKWVDFGGGPQFDYPIDYSIAVIDADVSSGRIDFLARWKPRSFCHYHRHLGSTVAVVVQGEQHVIDTREFETVTKVRRVGFSGPVPHGETHMEHAGDDELIMFFSTHAPDGRIFEVLGNSGEVLTAATISEFLKTMASEAA